MLSGGVSSLDMSLNPRWVLDSSASRVSPIICFTSSVPIDSSLDAFLTCSLLHFKSMPLIEIQHVVPVVEFMTRTPGPTHRDSDCLPRGDFRKTNTVVPTGNVSPGCVLLLACWEAWITLEA